MTMRSISSAEGTRHLVAAALEPLLVQPHRQRARGRHQADRAGGHAQAQQLVRRGLDDVQDGQARGRLHGVEPAMGGVAGDRDGAAARRPPGHGCRAAARAAGPGPPDSRAAVRSGTRGSDQRMVGMWSWSRSAGVSSVRRCMKVAPASGPMPPSTPRIRASVILRTPRPRSASRRSPAAGHRAAGRTTHRETRRCSQMPRYTPAGASGSSTRLVARLPMLRLPRKKYGTSFT